MIENQTEVKQKGSSIKKMKKIATFLYIINFIIQIIAIFVVYNTVASLGKNPDEINPPISLLFIILTILYFKNLLSKNKKQLEYEPWYKNGWGWFILLAVWPIIIFLGSYMLLKIF